MKKEYHLYLGRNDRITFTLPPSWVVRHYPEPGNSVARSSIRDMTDEALTGSEGLSCFERVVSAGKRVAVIVDDATRPTPVSDILDILLSRLLKSGIRKTDTTIVVALGTHQRLSDDGLRMRLGEAVTASYEVVQHDARHSDCVPVSVPGRKRPVKINRKVLESNVRIGIGSILPHPMAGFGGGPKLIMPALADFDSIVEHHMTHTIDEGSRYGQIQNNPFHHDCMIVAQTVGIDLLINCVYDLQGRIARVIAGTLDSAFRKAVRFCMDTLGLESGEKVDIVITSTYPHTHGLQMFKGLNGAGGITKSAGAILVVAPIVTPIPEDFIDALRTIRRKSSDPLAFARITMATGRLFVPEKSAEFNMAMYDLLKRPPVRTIAFSPLISRETAAVLGFEYTASLEEGLNRLKKTYSRATIAILPSGGLVIPGRG